MRKNLLTQYGDFLRANRTWWLASVVVALLLLGLLVFFGRTDAAPFIYTLY